MNNKTVFTIIIVHECLYFEDIFPQHTKKNLDDCVVYYFLIILTH